MKRPAILYHHPLLAGVRIFDLNCVALFGKTTLDSQTATIVGPSAARLLGIGHVNLVTASFSALEVPKIMSGFVLAHDDAGGARSMITCDRMAAEDERALRIFGDHVHELCLIMAQQDCARIDSFVSVPMRQGQLLVAAGGRKSGDILANARKGANHRPETLANEVARMLVSELNGARDEALVAEREEVATMMPTRAEQAASIEA